MSHEPPIDDTNGICFRQLEHDRGFYAQITGWLRAALRAEDLQAKLDALYLAGTGLSQLRHTLTGRDKLARDEPLTVAETAAVLGTTEAALHKRIKRGSVPATKARFSGRRPSISISAEWVLRAISSIKY